MAKMLQKWIAKRYLLMANKFGTKPFKFKDAETFLVKNFGDSTQIVSLVLSTLKNSDWLKVEIDPKDSRKRLYTLIMMYNEKALAELVMEVKEGKHERD